MLQLTGGDVTKMVDVAQNMGTLGTDAALKLMYNSMLSAPATHVLITCPTPSTWSIAR